MNKKNTIHLVIIEVLLLIIAVMSWIMLTRLSASAKENGKSGATASGTSTASIDPSSSFDGTIELPSGVKLEMVKCPAGSFMMGSPENGDWETQHRVTLTKDFYIGKYEVTQAQWQAVMGTTVRGQRDTGDRDWPLRGEGPDYPMYYVSWDEAMEFCEKLNSKGYAPEGWKFTLPTEAQWEYACRAGTTGKYNVSSLDAAGWYCDNSNGQTHPVGQKRPNAWGIYDMHGNVWEWCLDRYGIYTGDATDPTGPGSGSRRMERGGCCCDRARECRSASREDKGQNSRYGLGFRVALVPEK